MQHTPGPWIVRNIATRYHYIGPANDSGAPSFAAVFGEFHASEDQTAANARLISAAPDLLAALRECLACEFAVTDKAAIAQARAAIAKATGLTEG